jgi:dihydroorotate dehydrogenase
VGASAVQVGTATFLQPDAALRVIAGLRAELAARGIDSVREWSGVLCGEPLGEKPAAPAASRRRTR